METWSLLVLVLVLVSALNLKGVVGTEKEYQYEVKRLDTD